MDGLLRSVRPKLLFVMLGLSLAGCGGGGGGNDPPAPPAPPPPPPPGSNLPPLSSTVVTLDLNNPQQVGAVQWGNGNTSAGGQGGPVQGVECYDPPALGYHVHMHLSIFLNGQALAVPGTIGIVQTSPTTECTYVLHTHDDLSGLVHVAAPAQATFTLGQFFAIWGRTLSTTEIAGLTGMPVRVFVTDNGVVTENTGDWSTIEMTSHREITIQVGTDITEIPNFTWTGN
jgi:hypothetical protein